MAASGKTLDLFEPALDAARQPLKHAKRPEKLRSVRGRPAFEIAKRVDPPPQTTSHLRESLWLAITLPQLPLEALSRLQTEPLAAPPSPSAPAEFPNLTREVQQGSRGSQREKNSSSSRHSAPPEDARERTLTSSSCDELPAVVIDTSHNQQRVLACNAAAAQVGITPGVGLNTAYVLANALQVFTRDPAAEQRLLETLGQWTSCFTSKVALEAPDAVLLDIKGSLKLFGGLENLQALIGDGLRKKGVQAVLGVAPTPLAALSFSRTGQPLICLQRSQLPAALAAVPVSTLRWPEETLTTLHSMGVQKIGDCLRLPREGFARRFGPELLLQLDQLLGRASQPQRPFIARERFILKREFEVELEDRAALLLYVQPLLESLQAFLRSRQCGVQSLELSFRHRDQAPTRLILRFLRPMADAAHAHSLLAERLEQLELPAPVIAARVRSGPLWPLEMETITHRSLSDPQQGASQALTRLIERLRTRLGHDSVQALQCVPEHRPELASRVSEPVVQAKHRKRLASKPADPQASLPVLPRPFWLLPQPQLLQTQRSWPQFEGRLELLQGPERIESGWWDGHDICRDYYIAATPQGLRVWIYRERKSKQWYLHGIHG